MLLVDFLGLENVCRLSEVTILKTKFSLSISSNTWIICSVSVVTVELSHLNKRMDTTSKTRNLYIIYYKTIFKKVYCCNLPDKEKVISCSTVFQEVRLDFSKLWLIFVSLSTT